VTATDWIALGQAGLLAVAALFAWLTFRAQGLEQRREPLRRLVMDAIADLKAYALDLDSSNQRLRLSIALELLPEESFSTPLENTKQLTEVPFSMGMDVQGMFDAAAAELSAALAELGVGNPDSVRAVS